MNRTDAILAFISAMTLDLELWKASQILQITQLWVVLNPFLCQHITWLLDILPVQKILWRIVHLFIVQHSCGGIINKIKLPSQFWYTLSFFLFLIQFQST